MIGPVRIELEADKDYFFCTCKRGEKGVFCNGNHKGSKFTPKKFQVEKSKSYQLCSCQKSSRLPFCDGRHAD
ncbi:MAG: CDGSH iron-sulfur domain-containing protein [Sulfurospirillaceae bacterium]|nr:CDGSH iron-sulfur domain-containing protein [Sulfurospirillaceae bacterium]